MDATKRTSLTSAGTLARLTLITSSSPSPSTVRLSALAGDRAAGGGLVSEIDEIALLVQRAVGIEQERGQVEVHRLAADPQVPAGAGETFVRPGAFLDRERLSPLVIEINS